MRAPTKKTTRPYLAAPLRRDHLLEAAARLVRQGGWAALSMQGLAAASGVSRQLVYEHFANADELSVAALTHLFERAYDATDAILRAGKSLDATVAAAYQLFLDLPAEERRALRALASDMEPARTGLARAKRRLRTRIAGLWVPYVRQQTGLAEAEAAALAWMLITAGWGLADSVADGTLSSDRGVDLFVRFVAQALAASQVSSNRRKHRADRDNSAAVFLSQRGDRT